MYFTIVIISIDIFLSGHSSIGYSKALEEKSSRFLSSVPPSETFPLIRH